MYISSKFICQLSFNWQLILIEGCPTQSWCIYLLNDWHALYVFCPSSGSVLFELWLCSVQFAIVLFEMRYCHVWAVAMFCLISCCPFRGAVLSCRVLALFCPICYCPFRDAVLSFLSCGCVLSNLLLSFTRRDFVLSELWLCSVRAVVVLAEMWFCPVRVMTVLCRICCCPVCPRCGSGFLLVGAVVLFCPISCFIWAVVLFCPISCSIWAVVLFCPISCSIWAVVLFCPNCCPVRAADGFSSTRSWKIFLHLS